MRILHLSTRLILGGSQENTVLTCEGQADLGHDVGLVFGPIYGPEGSHLARARRHGGIETIETPHLRRDLSPWHDARCLHDLGLLMRAWRPDIVHTHSSKAGILGRLAAWRAEVPRIVHTIHGLAFHPWQSRWRNALYVRAERAAARRCHRIACVADAMRDQALAAGIGTLGQYVTVYSGMEVETFLKAPDERAATRATLGLGERDFVVGTIARLAELKGHDDLLDALGDRMRDDPTLRLLWVGDGWWRRRLLDRLASMGLADRVITTGLVDPTEIPSLVQAMDLLVHPSYREGLPRTVPQALLSGVPVVVYDVDGAREACLDGETGRLVPPGDRDGLRDAVHWMRTHPDAARIMAEAGRRLCRDRFDAGRMVEALEAVYEGIPAGASPSP